MQRTLVSYDDIAGPPPPPPPPQHHSQHHLQQNRSNGGPPNKKRKRNNNNQNNKYKAKGRAGSSAYASSSRAEDEGYDEQDEENEESRELTHEEIWDDSALIDAWNAAAEEYEALNGPDKGWKNEPVHKSPLWYNVPPPPETLSANRAPKAAPDADAEGDDSEPIDFNTFVPTHDPSLASGAALTLPTIGPFSIPDPSGPVATQDEAFNNALGAMYWAGYWTAVYHSHRKGDAIPEGKAGENEEVDDENEEEEEEEVVDYAENTDEGMLSTQR
ncbi:hypothetical protein PUNSTDRAFT_128921 [Punctularia strigosozonata HHB-11173 SS5]|uniref:uncharacterized protein n=1 Tax=Punctularia strigosozonata (strain HHB-11173) TaxID=741275 RepID=UPI00044186A1|nr:uncharacterized protein PUNSTDRAFT_128921 [Punctularia strigosozonata HHB-11173 SS5]EIN13234.1 hypothetical protein PUNSTDRAFT_128921 [Punctularia strigosozonata HHB-11173 SS5]